MAFITADRVRDTSTTTSTSPFVVSGTAPTGYQTFSVVMTTNDVCWYAAQHQTLAEWEVGLGTYSSANTLTRTTVIASSNAGSAVNFSAGTKDVFITLAAAKTIQRYNDGSVYPGSGGSTDTVLILNGITVTTNYTVPTNYNAGSFGPVTINSGATITVPSGSTWSVV